MAKKAGLKSLKVWLDAELHTTIKKLAAEDRRSMTAWIVHLVEREIAARNRAIEEARAHKQKRR